MWRRWVRPVKVIKPHFASTVSRAARFNLHTRASSASHRLASSSVQLRLWRSASRRSELICVAPQQNVFRRSAAKLRSRRNSRPSRGRFSATSPREARASTWTSTSRTRRGKARPEAPCADPSGLVRSSGPRGVPVSPGPPRRSGGRGGLRRRRRPTRPHFETTELDPQGRCTSSVRRGTARPRRPAAEERVQTTRRFREVRVAARKSGGPRRRRRRRERERRRRRRRRDAAVDPSAVRRAGRRAEGSTNKLRIEEYCHATAAAAGRGAAAGARREAPTPPPTTATPPRAREEAAAEALRSLMAEQQLSQTDLLRGLALL